MSPWILAARPKTLPAGAVPVIVGAALAGTQVGVHLPALLACLAVALLLQIGCNYANDACDALRGADDHTRLGPTRAVAAGLVRPRAMLAASSVVLALAFAVGLYLAWLGGWPLLVLGGAAVVCALAYTGGPYPLAYHGLGDCFVFLFFGLLATLGTAWIQLAAHMGPEAVHLPLWWWAVAVALGAQASAILMVNNIRDRSGDAAVGKRTLAVRLGPRGSLVLLAATHVLATGALAWAALLTGEAWLALPAILAGFGGGWLTSAVARRKGAALNGLLARSAALELITGTTLAATCMLVWT